MLVLSRKSGEKIVAPRCGLTITVLAIEGNKVRLGISAPAGIAVYREEVWSRLQTHGSVVTGQGQKRRNAKEASHAT